MNWRDHLSDIGFAVAAFSLVVVAVWWQVWRLYSLGREKIVLDSDKKKEWNKRLFYIIPIFLIYLVIRSSSIHNTLGFGVSELIALLVVISIIFQVNRTSTLHVDPELKAYFELEKSQMENFKNLTHSRVTGPIIVFLLVGLLSLKYLSLPKSVSLKIFAVLFLLILVVMTISESNQLNAMEKLAFPSESMHFKKRNIFFLKTILILGILVTGFVWFHSFSPN